MVILERLLRNVVTAKREDGRREGQERLFAARGMWQETGRSLPEMVGSTITEATMEKWRKRAGACFASDGDMDAAHSCVSMVGLRA